MKDICEIFVFSVIIISSIIGLICRFNSIRTSPTRVCCSDYMIDGYIIDAVVSDNQLYGHLPNDYTVYTLTVSAESASFFDLLFSSDEEIQSNYITLESVEVSEERPQPPGDFTSNSEE